MPSCTSCCAEIESFNYTEVYNSVYYGKYDGEIKDLDRSEERDEEPNEVYFYCPNCGAEFTQEEADDILESDELIEMVINKMWEDRYNNEEEILDMMSKAVKTWSDKERKQYLGE